MFIHRYSDADCKVHALHFLKVIFFTEYDMSYNFEMKYYTTCSGGALLIVLLRDDSNVPLCIEFPLLIYFHFEMFACNTFLIARWSPFK